MYIVENEQKKDISSLLNRMVSYVQDGQAWKENLRKYECTKMLIIERFIRND